MPALPVVAAVAVAGPATVAGMRDRRRVLIVAAPAADDPRLLAQRAALAGWATGAADRDVSVVEVIGATVTGAADPAAALRARYRLASGTFAAVLLGKDGHEAYRSAAPVTAATLRATIDAMPMRRAGGR